MKKVLAITLVLILAFSLNACRLFGKKDTPQETEGTTPPATSAPMATDPVTEPMTDPAVMDPTMETNIPDPNVDNEHLIDPTGDGMIDDAAREITRRINGLS